MQQSCKSCGQRFEIPKEDLAFYEEAGPTIGAKKFPIPLPTLCPDCRFQRRLAIRNERSLHHRKSDLTGKQIVAMYSPDKPFKVYDQDEWWSDRWDSMAYGRDFDFSQPFFEQFRGLHLAVPHPSLYTTNVVNSYYTNYVLHSKDCYLVFGGGNDENCLFGRFVIYSKDTVDGLSLYSCEWCYEGIASQHCYQCAYFMNCRHCTDCLMVQDCQSCRNCVCCFGLTNAEYCIQNQRVGKEAFEQWKQQLGSLTVQKAKGLREQLATLRRELPHRFTYILGSEDCTGDMVFNSKNCKDSFDITDCEDGRYLCYTPKGIRSYDCTYNAPDGVRFCYENCSTVGVERCLFSFLLRYSSDLLYCIECHNSRDLFGCVGLRNKQYCILNKQYSKEEYEELVPRIIEHMQQAGEFGEFFPIESSAYGYNESIAQELFPLTREQVQQRGWKWCDGVESAEQYLGPPVEVPVDVSTVDDSICEKILRCEVTGKPYKIIPQELTFYRTLSLPLPWRCPDQRHRERIAQRNPRKLWKRHCQKCSKEIQTTYSPDRPETIFCEQCYLSAVY